MSELSIFIDESGDFGQYDYRSPYYIVSMVFHNQKIDLSESIKKLEYELAYLNLEQHCIHAGPIIRAEEEYHHMSIEDRKKVFKRMVGFVRKVDVRCESIMAFGDSLNDATMLKYAGVSYALLSGKDAAKNAAKNITKVGNNEGGVGLAIKEYLTNSPK